MTNYFIGPQVVIAKITGTPAAALTHGSLTDGRNCYLYQYLTARYRE